METLIQEKVSQKANELTATYDEKLRNYEDRCVSYKTLLQTSNFLIIYQGNKTFNASSPLRKTNYEIYEYLMKITKPSFLITANDKVSQPPLLS
jgi:hypothetical protein